MPFLSNAVMVAASEGSATLQLNFDPSKMFAYTLSLIHISEPTRP